MLFSLFFVLGRFAEIVTLIPVVGMLSWFVNGYVNQNALTPNYILVLFIVSVLALAWSVATLFFYHRDRENARFVSFGDLLFVGAFIAAVYELRFIAGADCSSISPGDSYDISFGIFGSASINSLHVSIDKTCAMLEASFAFGIMNCIFFFWTAILAWFHGRGAQATRTKEYYTESHVSRHGHRRPRSHHSHHSSRRSHSSRRHAYV